MANARTKKKRSQAGTAIAAGIGIIMAAHIPSRVLFPHKAAPVVAMVAAMLVLIFVATRFTSVRQGIIYGAILGLLGGVSSFMGMAEPLRQLLRIDDYLRQQAATQPAATQPTTQPTTQPFTDEQRAKLLELRKRLPALCILPHVLMGTVIGGIFAQAAVRRRQRTTGMW